MCIRDREARERLRQPIRSASDSETLKSGNTWKLEKSIEEILDFGRRLPKVDFDQKQVTDDLYAYLDEE